MGMSIDYFEHAGELSFDALFKCLGFHRVL